MLSGDGIDPWEKKNANQTHRRVEMPIDPREKKAQIKPTDEMSNTLCDRRKGMVNKVLSA